MLTSQRLTAFPPDALIEQAKRNRARFPEDFMFQLSVDEKAEVIANCDHLDKLKFSKALPYAFTEHGAINRIKQNKGGLGDLGGGNLFLDAFLPYGSEHLHFLIHIGSRHESGIVDGLAVMSAEGSQEVEDENDPLF